MTYAKEASSEASKGTVGIQARDGRLQFNFPREQFGGKQIRTMSGYPDNKEG